MYQLIPISINIFNKDPLPKIERCLEPPASTKIVQPMVDNHTLWSADE